MKNESFFYGGGGGGVYLIYLKIIYLFLYFAILLSFFIRGHSRSLVIIRGHSWSLVCSFSQDRP